MKNVKKGNKEKRLPTIKPQGHLSRHSAVNSFDNLPALRGRKLVYCHSAPLQQRAMFREFPAAKKPNSAPAETLYTFQWPSIQEETDCLENSLNTTAYAEALMGDCEEGYKDNHPVQPSPQRFHLQNSSDSVTTPRGRRLIYCCSAPLPRSPARSSPSHASPLPKKPNSAPVRMSSCFLQWPATQEGTDHKGNYVDPDSIQIAMSRMKVKDWEEADCLQPQTLSPVYRSGESKWLHITPKSRELEGGQESVVKAENNLPEGRKGGGLLWRRRIKNGQWRPPPAFHTEVTMPYMLNDKERLRSRQQQLKTPRIQSNREALSGKKT